MRSTWLYWGYLLRQLRYGWVRAVALGVGVTLALGGSLVLAAATSASQAQIQGTVEDTPRSAYDILVRPPGSTQVQEVRDGVVRPNFLGGQYGGITVAQWRGIQSVPGVQVAAPVANVGFALPYTSVAIPVASIPHDPGDLVRLSLSWRATNGTATYPGERPLVFFAAAATDCDGLQFLTPNELDNPYGVLGPENVFLHCIPPEVAPGASVEVNAIFPLLIAGIDPEQEALLTDVEAAIVDGRMLQPGDTFTPGRFGPTVPVIASSRTYVDETLVVTPEALVPPAGQAPVDVLRQGNAYAVVDALTGPELPASTVEPADLYDRVLADLQTTENSSESFSAYWHVGPVSYDEGGDGVLTPRLVEQDPTTLWRDFQGFAGYAPVPPGNQDLHVRELTQHGSYPIRNSVGSTEVRLVGRFDPSELAGSDPRSRVPLETYVPPEAQPGDAATSQVLGGDPYLPSFNIGGYLNQPPHLLTTIDGARAMLSSRYFYDVEEVEDAPISAIRVRVADVTGNDETSLQRIQVTAGLIAKETGLTVDVTAGSSPQLRQVRIPPSEFGTPELLLSEPWAKKGVALAIVDALDRKSAALLALILGIAVVFLASTGLATVRSRRTEIATLRCLGWSPRHIFGVVLGEIALVGAAGGVLAVGLAWAGATLVHSPIDPTLLATMPLAGVALTAVAGLIPSMRAARMDPLEHLAPATVRAHPTHRLRGVLGMAVADVARTPGRSLLAALILALGVSALAVLAAITLAFQGTITGTLLGDYVAIEVRPADYVAAALVMVFAGLVLADILVLTMRERAPELATLRVIGWHDRHLARLVSYEGAAIGITGSLLGAAAGLTAAIQMGGDTGPALLACLLAATAGLAVTMAASTVPALAAARASISVVSAEA